MLEEDSITDNGAISKLEAGTVAGSRSMMFALLVVTSAPHVEALFNRCLYVTFMELS